MVKLKRNYTDTSQFDNGRLPFGKALATSLQWLYDDDEFKDDNLSEAEYDRNMFYYMDGVLPICDFMSVVSDVIYMAFQDFGEPNIKNYINLLMDIETRKWGYNKPYLQYDGDLMILGKVSNSTIEVILWAAYLYCHIRKEFESENMRVVQADKLLYKLYARQTGLKPELVKKEFLMKHFNKTALVFINNIRTSPDILKNKESDKQDTSNEVEMEANVLNRISANNIDYYFEGWRNGKKGAISQENGIYRFIEQTRGKSGMLDRVYHNTKDNPIVAVGIVAYWLMFKQGKDIVLQRLTKYESIPESMREMFESYTQERFNLFKKSNRDNPDAWDWDWDFEFFSKYIIPHEMELNKMSEALFDYISDDDIQLVRSVMNNYIKYLKKVRQEKGFHVSAELLVLRSLADSNLYMLEDLEDFEINTVLDQLESGGYIKVAWIEGHQPESIRLLDKGRTHLKHLESTKHDVMTPVKNGAKKGQTSKKQPKPKVPKSSNTFTKSTFTCKGLKDDQFIKQRLALFCDLLFEDFVATKEEIKAIDKERIEKLFTGKPLKNDEKIIWKGAKKELRYFFHNFRLHLEYTSKTAFWDIVASHFKIETEGKKIVQGKKKVRVVPISADSLQSTTEKPKKDMMKKLDEIIMTLTAPITDVLQFHWIDNEEESGMAREREMAEKDFAIEQSGKKGSRRK